MTTRFKRAIKALYDNDDFQEIKLISNKKYNRYTLMILQTKRLLLTTNVLFCMRGEQELFKIYLRTDIPLDISENRLNLLFRQGIQQASNKLMQFDPNIANTRKIRELVNLLEIVTPNYNPAPKTENETKIKELTDLKKPINNYKGE